MTRVLVVDDNAMVRTMVGTMLRYASMDVIEAGDGASAIRGVREVGIDLVICDLFMPAVDGLELIRALRREFPSVKIIAMSGGGTMGAVDVLTVARLMGAAEILEKPFVQSSLLAAVERALS